MAYAGPMRARVRLPRQLELSAGQLPCLGCGRQSALRVGTQAYGTSLSRTVSATTSPGSSGRRSSA